MSLKGVEALCSPTDVCYAYYDPGDLTTLRDAVGQLDAYVSAEGPFDAIMGFSAGAVLATVYLAQKQQQQQPIPFQWGVFIASADSTAEMDYMGLGGRRDEREQVRLPTVHIWGSDDRIAPTGGERLCKMFDETLRSTLLHEGGHDFPRQSSLDRTAYAIRGTIGRASQQTRT